MPSWATQRPTSVVASFLRAATAAASLGVGSRAACCCSDAGMQLMPAELPVPRGSHDTRSKRSVSVLGRVLSEPARSRRKLTPGSLTEDSLLVARTKNYLLAIARARACSGGDRIGLAWIDISTC